MKRLPLLPTLLVALAVATMIGLGVWQLQRKVEKEALVARYAAAQGLPPIAWPTAPDDTALYRRSEVACPKVVAWRTSGGRNVNGDAGWVHTATCSTGADVTIGWSARPDRPAWTRGLVGGVIGRNGSGLRLIATDPVPGLERAQPPSLDDIPNNHLFYALQWFFFAAAAAVIYVLALRRRTR